MTISYWQVASGEGGRDYSKVFLDYGVMLVGDGGPGPYTDRPDYYQKHDGQVASFGGQVKTGDTVALKRPHGQHGRFRQWAKSLDSMSTSQHSMMWRDGTCGMDDGWTGFGQASPYPWGHLRGGSSGGSIMPRQSAWQIAFARRAS